MTSQLYVIWDDERNRFTVGKGLIYMEEINTIVQKNGAENITFAWCSKNQPPDLFDLPKWGGNIQHYPNVDSAKRELGSGKQLIWGEKSPFSCSYTESLLYLQQACGNVLPTLYPKELWSRRASLYLKQCCDGAYFVVLHLKQNILNTLSNAQISEWKKFILSLNSASKNYFFVIVGNESPKELLELPNVKWTGGKNLCLDLAIIREGDMFMGMASAFCQMAMFGPKPYIIFKHPGHHTEEMKREFRGDETFSFCNARQRFIIANDTYETIYEQWSSVMKHA